MNPTHPTPLFALLTRLRAEKLISLETLEGVAARASPPWWLATLQALAAWLASLFLLSAFYVPVLLIGDSAVARGLGGLVLAAVALQLFQRDGVFVGQVALAFSLAAQALMTSALAGDFSRLETDHRMIAAVGASVALGMMIPRSTPIHRTACALVALVFGVIASFDAEWLAIQASIVCALSVCLWLTRNRWAGKRHGAHLKAVANAASVLALPAAWLLPILGGAWFAAHPAATSLSGVSPGAPYHVFTVVIGALLLATVFRLTRALPLQARVLALASAVALAFMARFAPGLIFAASLFLAAFHACHRPWASLALAAAILYLGEYYYSLQATLLLKAGALAACGLLLLALRQWLPRQDRT